jgi:hypothetical protein
MNEETRKLIFNENVPMSLIDEFTCKIKALTVTAEKLNSVMRETRSITVKIDCVEQMTLLLEKRIEAEEDFVKEARKYVKKGGAGDEEK